MLSDEVKRKTQQAALQQDEAAQARANEAAALKKAALLEQQVADLQVGPGVFTLRLQPLNVWARSSLENVTSVTVVVQACYEFLKNDLSAQDAAAEPERERCDGTGMEPARTRLLPREGRRRSGLSAARRPQT